MIGDSTHKPYKILITRSLLGHFFWTLIDGLNEKKLAESKMHNRYEGCLKVVNPIAKKLNAPIEFLDLEKDIEE